VTQFAALASISAGLPASAGHAETGGFRSEALPAIRGLVGAEVNGHKWIGD